MRLIFSKLIPLVIVALALLPSASSAAGARPAAPAANISLAGQTPTRHIVHLRPWGYTGTDRPTAARSVLGSGNLLWGHGPVQHKPVSYLIFWGVGWQTAAGGAPTAPAKIVEKYFNNLAGTAFERILTQYYDSAARISNVHSLAGVAFDPATPPTDTTCGARTIQDSSIQQEAVTMAKKLGWPLSSPNATFYVYTPSGYSVNDGAGDCSKDTFCAYHTWSTSTPGFAYALMAYPFDAGCRVRRAPNGNLDGDSLASMTSHEQFEAITDPQAGNGWIDASNFEIGDKCFWAFPNRYTRLRHGATFELQAEFSNASRSCVNTYTPPRSRRGR